MKSDPARFVLLIESLLHRCRQQRFNVTIVNTHGWVRGAGLDTLEAVCQAAQPTHVVLIHGRNPKRNVAAEVFIEAARAAAAEGAPPLPDVIQVSSVVSAQDASKAGQMAAERRMLSMAY